MVLATAEEEARQRGCTRVALPTLTVEAPGFYRKQGFDIVVTIDCDPPGFTGAVAQQVAADHNA